MRSRPTRLPNSSSESLLLAAGSRIGPASTPTYSSPPRSFLRPFTPPTPLRHDGDDSEETPRQPYYTRPSEEDEAVMMVTPESPAQAKFPHAAKDSETNTGMLLWGYALLVFSCAVLVVGLWAIIVGPFVDTSDSPLLDMIAKDKHYKYLLIFLIFVHLASTILSWWGLKIFRHA